MDKKRIMIMGVGNVLLRDEGVGVRVIKEIMARYSFDDNVRLVDGGVLGLTLTGTMMQADEVIVVDAVRGGDEPGTIYRFEWDCKPEHIQYKDSLHQIDMMETMGTLPLLGDPPRVVVIGVEYENISDWGMELTPKVEKAVETLISMALDEARKLGADPVEIEEKELKRDVFGHPGKSNSA